MRVNGFGGYDNRRNFPEAGLAAGVKLALIILCEIDEDGRLRSLRRYNWPMAVKKNGARFVEIKASVAKQRAWRIFSFVLDSATFDRIAFVSRRDDDKDAGYQRNLSKQRAADIAHYIDKENGCIPNSILVNLEEGATYDEKTTSCEFPISPRLRGSLTASIECSACGKPRLRTISSSQPSLISMSPNRQSSSKSSTPSRKVCQPRFCMTCSISQRRNIRAAEGTRARN